MNKIVVIFKDNQIQLISKQTSTSWLQKRFNIITIINKPLNSANRKIVMEYFNNHPEKIMQYYLK